MALFEELELWDNLIACYRLLQKKPQARRDLAALMYSGATISVKFTMLDLWTCHVT